MTSRVVLRSLPFIFFYIRIANGYNKLKLYWHRKYFHEIIGQTTPLIIQCHFWCFIYFSFVYLPIFLSSEQRHDQRWRCRHRHSPLPAGTPGRGCQLLLQKPAWPAHVHRCETLWPKSPWTINAQKCGDTHQWLHNVNVRQNCHHLEAVIGVCQIFSFGRVLLLSASYKYVMTVLLMVLWYFFAFYLLTNSLAGR